MECNYYFKFAWSKIYNFFLNVLALLGRLTRGVSLCPLYHGLVEKFKGSGWFWRINTWT